MWLSILSFIYAFKPESVYPVYISSPSGYDCKSARCAAPAKIWQWSHLPIIMMVLMLVRILRLLILLCALHSFDSSSIFFYLNAPPSPPDTCTSTTPKWRDCMTCTMRQGNRSIATRYCESFESRLSLARSQACIRANEKPDPRSHFARHPCLNLAFTCSTWQFHRWRFRDLQITEHLQYFDLHMAVLYGGQVSAASGAGVQHSGRSFYWPFALGLSLF